MLGRLVITAVFLFSTLYLGIQNTPAKEDPQKRSYIGAEACGMCHKTEKQGKQLDIWKNSKHAQAYKTLLTEDANKIAASLGHKTPAAKTEACLKCHASGYDLDDKMKEAKFKVEDGVQCETCHGPGSEYKSIKIMKDRKAAVANGLLLYEKVETLCVKCHNEESPTYAAGDLKEMWEKIKHPVPGSK